MTTARWFLALGALLSALAVTGQRWPGAVTPFGGTAFIAAWLIMAWSIRTRF